MSTSGDLRRLSWWEDWYEFADCHEDPELFFSLSKDAIADAKDICAGCPVRELCLEAALDRNEKYGVWGGTTYDERRRLLRDRRRRPAA